MKNKLILTFLTIFIRNFTAENFFVIVIPSYNNKDWYQNNLNSVINQTYKNYKVIYIDDCSTDNTAQLVENYIKEHDKENKITLIKNEKRKGALENLYIAIHTCKPSDIIVCLDGDDWLAHGAVLEKLDQAYQNKNVWLTYGQFQEHPNGNMGSARELPEEIIKNCAYRQYDWVTSALRTFYAALFHKIKKEDLLYQGQFYPMAWDVAMMYPMLEMAGSHSKFIDEILYIYNRATPLNDNKVNKELQCQLYTQIRAKERYKPLNNLDKNNKKFVILIPSYNNSRYYRKNLDSVIAQTYKNYRVVYVDDNSSDGTAQLVENYIKDHNKENVLTLVKNKKRELALANIYKSVINCDDDEIIVLLDGDDWFANKHVLQILNALYSRQNIWMTYGNLKYLSNDKICEWALPIPEHVLKNNEFREYRHGLPHLRTFYAWLFKQIKIEDFYHETDFYKMTYDVAIFLPMIEMASERHLLIKTVLYIYNNLSPINDDKVSMQLQHNLNALIRQKPKYSRLPESKENFLDEFDNAKVDIIIFSYNDEKLKELLKTFKSTKNTGKIFIIYNFDENIDHLIKTYQNIIFLNKNRLKDNINKVILNSLKNNNPYIYITNDTYSTNVAELNKNIKDIELTKAFAFYYFSNNKALNEDIANKFIEVINQTYSFEFENYTISPFISGILLRKKDLTNSHIYTNLLSNFELEWKYLGWKKICLLKQVGN